MRAPVENRAHSAVALRMLAIGIGLFFVAMSAQKIAWLVDDGLLSERLHAWLPTATPGARWLLETVAIPGVALLARVVPLAELATGCALILGVWTRAASTLALIMGITFHFAMSTLFAWDFLGDATGPPLLAGLLALAIAGKELPFALLAARGARVPQRLPVAEPTAYTELS